MEEKNATCVSSVSLQNSQAFRFFGYRLELPNDLDLLEIQMIGKRYRALTSTGPINLRACPRCKSLLPLTEFYKTVSSSCKKCHFVLAKRWTKNHPELAKQYAKKYGKKYRYQKKLLDAGVK